MEQHHTSQDLNFYHVLVSVLEKFRTLLLNVYLEDQTAWPLSINYVEAMYINNPLQHFSTEQCLKNTTRHILRAHFSNSGYNTTLYITISIVWLEVLRQMTVNTTVFKNIMLCSFVANVAMIHRNLLPSYGEERSACSHNTLVPVYSTTQYHIQQERILHDIYFFSASKSLKILK